MKTLNIYSTIFHTNFGRCGLSWNPNGIISFFLPDKNEKKLKEKMKEALGDKFNLINSNKLSVEFPEIEKASQLIALHLDGKRSSLDEIVLDYSHLSPFFTKVYQKLRQKIVPGELITYGELGKLCGSPKGARAVGHAMRRNPFPLLVPCHRVVSSKVEMRGFSAYGGIETKLKLLKLEGAIS